MTIFLQSTAKTPKKYTQTKITAVPNHPLAMVSTYKLFEFLYSFVYDLVCVNIVKSFISITLLDIAQLKTHIKSKKRHSDEIMKHHEPKRQKRKDNSVVEIEIASPQHERKNNQYFSLFVKERLVCLLISLFIMILYCRNN